MNMNISDLKKYVGEQKINITPKEIKTYLDQRFKEENKKTKQRMETNKFNCVDHDTIKEYFNRYASIVKNKATILLNIIEKIGNKDTISITDELSNLDINLNEDGNILKSDMIRLIEPAIYNIEELKQKVEKANDVEAYLVFKISLDFAYRAGLSEDELYPYEVIQIKSIMNDYHMGNVKLSANQVEEIDKSYRKSYRVIEIVL